MCTLYIYNIYTHTHRIYIISCIRSLLLTTATLQEKTQGISRLVTKEIYTEDLGDGDYIPWSILIPFNGWLQLASVFSIETLLQVNHTQDLVTHQSGNMRKLFNLRAICRHRVITRSSLWSTSHFGHPFLWGALAKHTVSSGDEKVQPEDLGWILCINSPGWLGLDTGQERGWRTCARTTKNHMFGHEIEYVPSLVRIRFRMF